MAQHFTILEEISKSIQVNLLNNMYNGIYKYTLNRYREAFKQVVKANSRDIVIQDDVIDQFLITKMNTEYYPNITKRIEEIHNIPHVEQKSPEWFKLREDMISASDAGYFLKKCGAYKALDSLKIKLGLKNYVNSSAPPLTHGNTYEDITRAIYETRNRVRVFEYGILSSSTSCIGASPDGIVVECLDNTYKCKAKYGRLLEIKNPYSREIDNTIKPEYMVQILQQQYTTGLPVCDFVETTIVDKYCKNTNYKPYETLQEMLDDKLDTSKPNWQSRIKNKYIPYENLNKFGNEKGLVVWYQKIITENDIRNKYILYPLGNIYQSRDIEKWIIDTNSQQFTNGFIYKETKYWRLDVYAEKTVVYDQKLYEGEYIPTLTDVWNIITECRTIIKNKGNIENYIEDLENRKDTPFYNENKRKKKNTLSTTPSLTTPSLTTLSSTNINNTFEDNDIELDF
jgi:hypothetical protein